MKDMSPKEYRSELQAILDKLRATRADPERIEKVKKTISDLDLSMAILKHARDAAKGYHMFDCNTQEVAWQPCIHDKDEELIGILCKCCKKCRQYCLQPINKERCTN